MQTHSDFDVPETLRQKAIRMQMGKLCQITAGKPGEDLIGECNVQGVHVAHRPDDEHGISRISIGGKPGTDDYNYCVFRGDRQECINLLNQSIKALRGFLGEGTVDPSN